MDDDLDRILSSDQDVVPSTRFVRNVMVAVNREASTPSTIEFPWWRVLPALTICLCALASLLFFAVIRFAPGAGSEPSVLSKGFEIANRCQAGWVSLAIAVSYVPIKLALARR